MKTNIGLSHEDDLKRKMFSSSKRITAEILERVQKLNNLAQEYSFLRSAILMAAAQNIERIEARVHASTHGLS